MNHLDTSKHFNQGKLVRLLCEFSSDDLIRLSAFVKSPYFNTNQHLIALLDYLLLFAPEFASRDLNHINAYKTIFQQTIQEEEAKAVVAKLASKLLQLCRQFIEQEQLREMPFMAAYFRKKWFAKYGKPDWEEESLRQMKSLNAENKIYDGYKSLCEYLTEFESVQLTASAHLVMEKLDLSDLNRAIDQYFIHEKLVTLCNISNHALITNQKYELPEVDQVIELLKRREKDLDAGILIWYKALYLLTQPDSSPSYHALRSDWLKYNEKLSELDNNTLFQYLLNTARFVFQNSNEYRKELVELYKYQIDAGKILNNGRMIPEVFYNIVTLFVSDHKLDWASNFYAQYKGKLDPGNKKSESILYLSESFLNFENRQYEKALEIINNANFNDIQSKLTERRMRIKIYAELDYDQLLADQINAFRKFISVNKSIIPEHHVMGNLAFINAAAVVMKIPFEGDSARKKLKKLIAENQILPEKNWLLKKLEG